MESEVKKIRLKCIEKHRLFEFEALHTKIMNLHANNFLKLKIKIGNHI